MTHYDVFNGDGDGLCALHQLRLARPQPAVLVTGAKRDIALLDRVPAQAGDTVTVLDISADTNRAALVTLLDRGVRVEYFDHHYAGDLPVHPHLTAVIDGAPQVCTGMLVDRALGGRHRIWAVVAAYADNLERAAGGLSATLALPDPQRLALRELGQTLTHNGYGDSEADLVLHPAELYRLLAPYADPFEFMRAEPMFGELCARREADLALARAVQPAFARPGALVYELPDAPWSRRARGVFANELAHARPTLAHAVLTRSSDGGYGVSVRAPVATNRGADALCRKFATGGGREAAAGINQLPPSGLAEFLRELDRAYPGAAASGAGSPARPEGPDSPAGSGAG
jgi:hypothetical protein